MSITEIVTDDISMVCPGCEPGRPNDPAARAQGHHVRCVDAPHAPPVYRLEADGIGGANQEARNRALRR